MHQTVTTGTVMCGHSILTSKTILKQLLAKRVWMGARELNSFKLLFASIVNYFAVYHQNINCHGSLDSLCFRVYMGGVVWGWGC